MREPATHDKLLNEIEQLEKMINDKTTYLEMARLGMAMIPDELMEEMCLSDEEFVRLRDNLKSYLDNELDCIDPIELNKKYA